MSRLSHRVRSDRRVDVGEIDDLDRSLGTHTVGQSGHPASPHFRDLVPLWSKGEYHPLPFGRDEVDAVAEATLMLLPR